MDGCARADYPDIYQGFEVTDEHLLYFLFTKPNTYNVFGFLITGDTIWSELKVQINKALSLEPRDTCSICYEKKQGYKCCKRCLIHRCDDCLSTIFKSNVEKMKETFEFIDKCPNCRLGLDVTQIENIENQNELDFKIKEHYEAIMLAFFPDSE